MANLTHSLSVSSTNVLEIDVANMPTGMKGGTAMSFGCWIRPTSLGIQRPIMSQWVFNSGSIFLELTTGEDLKLYWSGIGTDVGSITRVPGTDIVANEWRHVGFTVGAGTDDVQLFLDGVPLGTSAGAGTALYTSSTATWNLGTVSTDSVSFLGQLANVQQWSSVISDAQMLAQSLQFEPVTYTALELWLPLMEGITDQRDMSGNGVQVDIEGSPTFSTEFPTVTEIEAAGGGGGALAGGIDAQIGSL